MTNQIYPPAIDPQLEGTYRRGYHQAVAEIANALRNRSLTPEELDAWVEGPGMTWRKDVALIQMVAPPPI